MDDTEKFDDKKFTEALQGEDAASAGSFQAVLQGFTRLSTILVNLSSSSLVRLT